MGTFYEEITLTNVKDDVRVACGLLKEIRTLTLAAMPDTGAWTLVINEETRRKLGLAIVETVDSSLGLTGPEGMDLYVDPVNQRLAGVHGDRRVHLVK
jgi:hypothetical protein